MKPNDVVVIILVISVIGLEISSIFVRRLGRWGSLLNYELIGRVLFWLGWVILLVGLIGVWVSR
jgi:hypothetical protein